MRLIAYNKSRNDRVLSCISLTKKKNPLRRCELQRGSSFFSACCPYPVRQATCRCSLPLHLLRRTEGMIKYHAYVSPPLPIKWSGAGQRFQYSIFRHKRTSSALDFCGQSFTVLALSVPCGDTSPTGRGKTLPSGPWLPLWGSWQSRRL